MPTIIDRIDAIKTAPAAMSFALPISGLNSGTAASAISSMAVFSISQISTKEITAKSISHSMVLM